MSRLLILVALLVCLAVVPSAARCQLPTWRVVEQTAHNETSRLLTASSANTYASADGSLKRVTLQFKCSGALTTSATISADDIFAVKSEATVTLPVRLDGEPAIRAAWANLSLHHILIYDLRDLLPSHRSLAIDLPLGDGSPQTLTFDLSELASVMREHNCRRRL